MIVSPNEEKQVNDKDFLTDIVIGMSDGLIVPFALTAGLSGIVASCSTIVAAGITAITAGAVVMGLGGYQAGKSEMQTETELPERKIAETKAFLANIGLNEEMQQKAIDEIEKDRQQWDDLTRQQLASGKLRSAQAARSGLYISLSYAAGGLVPVCPYFFTATPLDGLKLSAVITLFCLFLFGFFRSRIMGLQPWEGALRSMLVGAAAAGAAYGVANLF